MSSSAVFTWLSNEDPDLQHLEGRLGFNMQCNGPLIPTVVNRESFIIVPVHSRHASIVAAVVIDVVVVMYVVIEGPCTTPFQEVRCCPAANALCT